MRLLLDTNIVVYLATDQSRLSDDVRELLMDYDNLLYVSAETIKELILAYRTKGLWGKIWKEADEIIKTIKETYRIEILPLKEEHMATYAKMYFNDSMDHNDPSDHVIIAHALTESLTLVSSDNKFPYYRNQGLDLIQN